MSQRFAQAGRHLIQIFRQRQVKIDSAACRRANHQFFHIHVRRVQEGAAIADRQHRQCIGLAHGGHAGTFNRVDRDIYRIALTAADLLADIQHRCFINLAFTDHDAAIDIHFVEHNAHCVDRGAVGGILVAASQPFVARQRGGFGNTGKFDG
ncbi:hypothetical protein D3C76_1465420 [compost metagenome]